MRVALSRLGEGETLQQVNYNNGFPQKVAQNIFCKTSNETVQHQSVEMWVEFCFFLRYSLVSSLFLTPIQMKHHKSPNASVFVHFALCCL